MRCSVAHKRNYFLDCYTSDVSINNCPRIGEKGGRLPTEKWLRESPSGRDFDIDALPRSREYYLSASWKIA